MAMKLTSEEALSQWSDEERALLARHQAGETIVVNKERHKALWAWARAAGVAVFIGRPHRWKNPFRIPRDGDRETVCDRFAAYYERSGLPGQVHTLKGKVLGCYCAPERCHGDFLARETERER
jgi:hypothetical protein